MTKLTYNLILFLVATLSTSLQAAEPAIKKEITREVHEIFDVSPGAKLSVQNKYGDINVTTWNKNQIKIDVLIKVKSSNTEKAQKFLDEISIDFNSTSSKVSALTTYPDNNNSSWWSGWFGNGKNIDYEVHYTIQAPTQMSTHLVNKYGDIVQASIDGDSEVTNKYGNISYKDVSGDFDLTLGYGKATIGEVGDAKMQVKYSSIKLISSKDLSVSTKYSDFKIKSCDHMTSTTKYDEYSIESMTSLKNDGKYDEFVIGSIDDINIDTKYTDLNINTLNSKGIFDTRYGNVNVKSTGSNLNKITINSKYTGYEFNIANDFHLNFDGSKTDLHVKQPYEKYQSHKDGSDLQVKAYRGSKEGGAQIIANMRYGDLDIY